MIWKMCSAVTDLLISVAVMCLLAFGALLLMGFHPYVVRSGSMEPAIQAGSLCFIDSHAPYQEIQEGDIAAFRLPAGSRVVHRVIRVTEEGAETKGDANDRSDGISVFEGNYIGKAIFSVPALGYFVAAVQSGRGKILGLTGIVCLLISGAFLRETKVKKN